MAAEGEPGEGDVGGGGVLRGGGFLVASAAKPRVRTASVSGDDSARARDEAEVVAVEHEAIVDAVRLPPSSRQPPTPSPPRGGRVPSDAARAAD